MAEGQATTQADDATAELAGFAAALRFEDLPRDVVAHVRLAVLDALGCCLVGATLPWTRVVAEQMRADGGTQDARLIGLDGRVPLAAAVLVNSTAGHAFELDDIHRDSIIHPNSIAVPVALGAAEAWGVVSGADVLTAIVAGYEISTRIGMAAGTELLLRGFHPQGTGGAFTAAATAAKMRGLDADGMRHALGIAGSLGAGLMASQEGAMVKRLHSGNAAQAGVRAAQLAARGFTGIPNVVEADYGGFLAAFSGKVDTSPVVDGLGERWETVRTGIKPHATVTSIHSALDALSMLMAEHGLAADDIAHLKASVSTPTYVHCAWPYKAQSVTAAQMNLYYGLATIALDGQAFVEQFAPERIAEPRVFDFIERIEAEVDPEIDALGPAYRHMARLTVTTCDGRTLTEEVRHRRGSPEDPVSAEDIVAKFCTLAGRTRAKDDVMRAIELTGRLETLDDVCELIDTVAGETRQRPGGDAG